MQLSQADLFIAVFAEKKGEFYLNLDAHEQGYRGRLQQGVTEGGFVRFEEVNSYLFNFEVYSEQTISFDVKLNIATGNADLYLQRCPQLNNCRLQMDD